MGFLHPCNGGCWFCHEDEEHEYHVFDEEFDTYVHKSCIRKELSKDPASVSYNPEAEMMEHLLD